jgi:ABC-type multidrug transport system ATPase subunit
MSLLGHAMNWAIETHGLSRSFGQVTAVSDLRLQVPTGSVFGFLGPNGAGKTTTIRMLLDLIKPSAGDIALNGHSIRTARTAALSGVGAIVESPALYPNLTGLETLNLAAGLSGHTSAEVHERLDQVGLSAAARRRVGGYSLGMRQRLALARAMLGSPKLLILDEPTNGLDPAGIADMRQLIRALPETLGATVFLSSHLLSEIEQTATHCALVDRGRLLLQGTLESLMDKAPTRLAIETDRPEALTHRFLEQNRHAEHLDGIVRVDGQFDPGARSQLVAALTSEGFGISGLWVERASLEDLFLTLTGSSRERSQ